MFGIGVCRTFLSQIGNEELKNCLCLLYIQLQPVRKDASLIILVWF